MDAVKRKLEENFMFDFKDNDQCFIFYEICNDLAELSFNKCMKYIGKEHLRKSYFVKTNDIQISIVRSNMYVDIYPIVNNAMLKYVV